MPAGVRSGVRAGLLGLACALGCCGCGIGPGSAPSSVSLLVTRDFGSRRLGSSSAPRVAGQETVMSLLMRNYSVSTRYGGGFVQSIDGLAGGQEAGEPVDWFYYVNGVEASKGAADVKLHAGDHVWWDHHDWSQTEDVPAVVGSFPEPFLNGLEGKRLPVRIECESVSGPACRAVNDRMTALGVPAAIAAPGSPGGTDTLSILVGVWPTVEGYPPARGLAEGPGANGVYARFAAHGHTLTVLDQNGRPVRTLSGTAGLIAATREEEEAPSWIVTGTDRAGMELAARSLDAATLQGHFAVALTPGGAIPLPQVSPGG
jgi:hypothetical protein